MWSGFYLLGFCYMITTFNLSFGVIFGFYFCRLFYLTNLFNDQFSFGVHFNFDKSRYFLIFYFSFLDLLCATLLLKFIFALMEYYCYFYFMLWFSFINYASIGFLALLFDFILIEFEQVLANLLLPFWYAWVHICSI